MLQSHSESIVVSDRVKNSLESVERASLRHASDLEPGFTRRKSGKGFAYRDLKGRPIVKAQEIDRINRLAIPPAWTDVWISPDADGHIQATGRDVKGRKQYRYHQRWSACRDEVKYSGLAAFAKALPAIRAKVDADLRKRGMPREKVLAAIVWLLDNTMIRVGNASYARDNRSFGLTTLRDRHMKVEGAKVKFSFMGKSGKEWNLQLTDRRIARVLKQSQDLPGQQLFQYVDDSGERRGVQSGDVNAYLHEAGGADFTSKHFRTWGGTVRALELLAETTHPDTKAGERRVLNATIDEVSSHLGNTRAVCRKCYVHPAVITAWEEDRLAGEVLKLGSRLRRKLPKGLDPEEALVAAWLEKHAA